jgi:acyl-lipid omega-6 desaturase (Delta-12 desaturase)
MENNIKEIAQVDKKKIQRDLRIYQQPSRLRSTWQITNSLVPFVALWYLGYRILQYSFWLSIPVIILLAGFQIRAFIIFHDCGHGSFFRSKRVNDFWGILTGLLSFTPYHFWRDAHTRHHGTSANLDKRGEGDVWMMTVDEYRSASTGMRLKYRLYRNPFVMFILGPLLLNLITHRIPFKAANRSDRISIYATNLMVALGITIIVLTAGFKAFLLIHFLSLFIAHIVGVWLFYVQHQFEGVYWERSSGWEFFKASLEGGSFYKLPAIIRWFTGSIGYHHVHHLSSRIPNYRLGKCHDQVPILREVKPIKLIPSLKGLKFRLWDEENSRLVGYKEAARGMNK